MGFFFLLLLLRRLLTRTLSMAAAALRSKRDENVLWNWHPVIRSRGDVCNAHVREPKLLVFFSSLFSRNLASLLLSALFQVSL